ncbi:MFS transporter [Streptomyces sp. AS58]|uniref:MFS transporter n=1 Tax=Streptomyces cadmiisoli TaxID=2184053 RepID=A0A2Z4ITM1_9ACTN|nr:MULTISPECIES: MFS transporter [Streptomyces]AWW35968.1 MFS transporter [Streptomyces cadmiisoli]KOV69937.1 MFS transporter [Streptomyces sp. AS58]
MKRSDSPSAAVAALAGAGLLAALLQTLVIPLIPAFPELLDAPPTSTSWVVTITLLTGAIVTPVSGRLGDLFGKRRALISTLGVATTGTVISALTSALPLMVIGRGLQGFAMGVIPLALGILRDRLPPHRTGSAIALLTGTLGLGGAMGIPLAGLVAEHFDWHVLFWGAAGLGVLCTLVIAAVVPETPRRSQGRFDVVGALGLGAGLIGLLLPIVNGGKWGWGSARTLGLAAAAVVILLAWGRHQLRSSSPLVDLRLSARRPVLMTNLATVASGFSIYTMLFVFPQILQAPPGTGYGLGQSLVRTGLAVAPNGVAALLVSPLAARMIGRYGARAAIMLGASLIATGYVFIAVQMTGVAQFVLASCIIGAGAGISVAAISKLITDVVPVTDTASANGVNNLMRSFGTSVASAVLAAILAQATVTAGGVTVPSEGAFRTTLIVGASAALLVVALSALVPTRTPPPGGSTQRTTRPLADRTGLR